MDHIQKHQAEMRARISGSYNPIEKSQSKDNDIKKGGAGSGRKSSNGEPSITEKDKPLGYTKSKKPIYAISANHEQYKNFSAKDHKDARNFHEDQAWKEGASKKHHELHYGCAASHNNILD